MLLLAALLACAPPSCGSACEKVVDECGLGTDIELCLDRCADIARSQGAARPRHDVRDCFAKADCGQILAGECADYAQIRYCYGGYFAVSSECLDAPAAFYMDLECQLHSKDDWGDLGAPTYVPIGHEGSGAVVFGDCTATDPQGTGVAACGECTVALFEVL